MEKLTEQQTAEHLAELPEWGEIGGEIQRTYQFDNFVQAIAFVNKIADAAEAAEHHPDILIRYNKVTLTLSTHDAGGITMRDFDLAGRVDQMAHS